MSYADELTAAYPDAVEAVVFVELIYCTADDEHPVCGLDLIRQKRPDLNPRDVAEMIAASVGDIDISSMGEKAELIREQLRHPDFSRYIAGKMGCV